MPSIIESGVVLVVLIACLIALILVSLARREAKAVREQASLDASELREHMKDRARDLEARHNAAAAKEKEISTERRAVRRQHQRLDERETKIAGREFALIAQEQVVEARLSEGLEALTGISVAEAKAKLKSDILTEAQADAAQHVRRIESEARITAEANAHKILAAAMQRLAVPVSSASSVTSVTLPSDDMRGRVIGKEGRNIHTFQALTGVDLLLEDNSDVVVLSSFDPERREIAAEALKDLLADGRINPYRIEEAVARSQEDASNRSLAAGQEAAFAVGVRSLPEPVLEVLGQLRLRTSYGQNVLLHSVESALVAALVAAEMGADVQLSRRAALLHDIGKAFTSSIAGTHAQIGADFLNRHGESAAVVNAVAAHHDEVPKESVEAVLVQVADACSAARPGARREDVELFAARLEKLESLALEHPGISKALVMSAGRELRVVVEPNVIGDADVSLIASQIAQKIEDDVETVGQVHVTVIRELRATATARSQVPADGSGTESDTQQ